ncbi:hypothetical protein EI94DRAFT_1705213 [Lactarius quietus]|nr:hypothetical protein EI94DRAFT_1705213 [Lactarius quietus]
MPACTALSHPQAMLRWSPALPALLQLSQCLPRTVVAAIEVMSKWPWLRWWWWLLVGSGNDKLTAPMQMQAHPDDLSNHEDNNIMSMVMTAYMEQCTDETTSMTSSKAP